eukprot:1875049-Prymnesium_polylepis.2
MTTILVPPSLNPSTTCSCRVGNRASDEGDEGNGGEAGVAARKDSSRPSSSDDSCGRVMTVDCNHVIARTTSEPDSADDGRSRDGGSPAAAHHLHAARADGRRAQQASTWDTQDE